MKDIQFIINDRDLGKATRALIEAPKKSINISVRWLKRMTNLTERKMKQYSRSKTARSTGRLSSSITSSYNIGQGKVSSLIYVPEDIRYQFAAEEGVKRSFAIRGKPTMHFQVDEWKNPTSSPNKDGYFVFKTVRRGRYKGRKFTARAFADLMNYYSAHAQTILNEIGSSFLFSLT